MYNLAGKDGKEDFDLLVSDAGHESIDWNDVVEEEYSHYFGGGDDDADVDVFDANDKSFRVRPLKG